jgi:hypothetical protein
VASKTLIYEHDKDTKRYAKFVPARGERAVGAIYLELDEEVTVAAGEGRLHVTVEVLADA